MKIVVKTLRGTTFDVQVNPHDSVTDVKKNIEAAQGAALYPASQQMLIYQGKVLKDNTTLKENKVTENSVVVIMLAKNKSSTGEASTSSAVPVTKAPETSAFLVVPVALSPLAPLASSIPVFITTPAPPPISSISAGPESYVYGHAASNLVAGTNFEGVIQQILVMGEGSWDRATVVSALRAADNNPERAVKYLYSGNLEQTANPPAQPMPSAPPAPVPAYWPNANPSDIFLQGYTIMGSGAAGSNTLDFLRNSPQFQDLRSMVQANPQILKPMIQELGRQNPHLTRLIQQNQGDFLRLINEPVEGGEGNILGQLAASMPQTVQVTNEEPEAIERLVAMGFDLAIVLEVYFSCNMNEELAAHYLLSHKDEFED